MNMNQINAVIQQKKNQVLNDVYQLDLGSYKEHLNALAEKSKRMWEKKKGQAQVSNTVKGNLTGHMAELATKLFIERFYGVEAIAPDLDAYACGRDFVSKHDIKAGGLNIQVKGISDPIDPKYQVTVNHVDEYCQNGTHLVVFVYVNQDTYKANIYGITSPQEMKKANKLEENMNRDPAKRQCYSAESVHLRPWM